MNEIINSKGVGACTMSTLHIDPCIHVKGKVEARGMEDNELFFESRTKGFKGILNGLGKRYTKSNNEM